MPMMILTIRQLAGQHGNEMAGQNFAQRLIGDFRHSPGILAGALSYCLGPALCLFARLSPESLHIRRQGFPALPELGAAQSFLFGKPPRCLCLFLALPGVQLVLHLDYGLQGFCRHRSTCRI
jgi:hypothetical protein